MSFSRKDYPLAENRGQDIKGKRAKSLDQLTLDAVLKGHVTIEDLRITPQALQAQADVARSAGRPRLAENFERAAELVDVPQEEVMAIYELLRPGRARSKEQLLDAARKLRTVYHAKRMAEFVAAAADVYENRGLFNKRY
jgi:propanediol dehydratase small subunit